MRMVKQIGKATFKELWNSKSRSPYIRRCPVCKSWNIKLISGDWWCMWHYDQVKPQHFFLDASWNYLVFPEKWLAVDKRRKNWLRKKALTC